MAGFGKSPFAPQQPTAAAQPFGGQQQQPAQAAHPMMQAAAPPLGQAAGAPSAGLGGLKVGARGGAASAAAKSLASGEAGVENVDRKPPPGRWVCYLNSLGETYDKGGLEAKFRVHAPGTAAHDKEFAWTILPSPQHSDGRRANIVKEMEAIFNENGMPRQVEQNGALVAMWPLGANGKPVPPTVDLLTASVGEGVDEIRVPILFAAEIIYEANQKDTSKSFMRIKSLVAIGGLLVAPLPFMVPDAFARACGWVMETRTSKAGNAYKAVDVDAMRGLQKSGAVCFSDAMRAYSLTSGAHAFAWEQGCSLPPLAK
jgi:hypothetical protein